MKNVNVIKVKYLGATNTKGSRVKIVSDRFKSSVTLGYNYEFNSALEIACDYLTKLGFDVIGCNNDGDIGYIITSTFEDIK